MRLRRLQLARSGRPRIIPVAALVLLVAGLATGCGGDSKTVVAGSTTSGAEAGSERSARPVEPEVAANGPDGRELVELPLAVYIVDDAANQLSSRRTIDEVEVILADVAEVWLAAGIRVSSESVERIEVSATPLAALARGRLAPFFAEVSASGLPGPRAGAISAFFVSSIGGPNGIAPSGTRSILVVDEPSVHDERVTAHEIGHVLALHHALDDSARLMFPGTNGMNLTGEELRVANYAASGYADAVR